MCVYSLNKFFFTAFKKERFEQTADGNRELLEESVPLTVSMSVNSPYPVCCIVSLCSHALCSAYSLIPETHTMFGFAFAADVVVACSIYCNHGCSVEVVWKDVQGLGEVS